MVSQFKVEIKVENCLPMVYVSTRQYMHSNNNPSPRTYYIKECLAIEFKVLCMYTQSTTGMLPISGRNILTLHLKSTVNDVQR